MCHLDKIRRIRLSTTPRDQLIIAIKSTEESIRLSLFPNGEEPEPL